MACWPWYCLVNLQTGLSKAKLPLIEKFPTVSSPSPSINPPGEVLMAKLLNSISCQCSHCMYWAFQTDIRYVINYRINSTSVINHHEDRINIEIINIHYYQLLLYFSYTFRISFSAWFLASFTFCLSLKLSSSKSLRLCSLSARSMESESFYVSSFSRIFPQSTPHMHFSFNCLFYSLRTPILYLIWLLWSLSSSKPWIIWSYRSSMHILLWWCTLSSQMPNPCRIPFFMLLEKELSAIKIPILFFSLYSLLMPFN